jgi:hypothetical protein
MRKGTFITFIFKRRATQGATPFKKADVKIIL